MSKFLNLRISVIIPIYNKIEIVQNCILLNMQHANEPCKWILIDNNSDLATKNGLLELKSDAIQLGHEFIIIEEKENTGVARAWNKGLQIADSEYVCILNNDAVMMPNWANLLIETMQKNNLAIASPFVLEKSFLKTYYLEHFLKGAKNYSYYIHRNYKRIRKGIFGGVIIFGEKSNFEKIGAFDERFWLSHEDIDFLWRANCLGLAIGVIGDVVAYHYSSLTRKDVGFDEQKNEQLFEQKHGWNFAQNENSFFNKLIKSRNKRLLSYFGLMGTLNPFMPKENPY